MFEQEKYTDENGETKFRKTDNIHVNSFVQYMLFVREVIEKYTNLIHSDTEAWQNASDTVNRILHDKEG